MNLQDVAAIIWQSVFFGGRYRATSTDKALGWKQAYCFIVEATTFQDIESIMRIVEGLYGGISGA